MLSNGLDWLACKRICVSDQFERWNNRLKHMFRNRGFPKPVHKSFKIVHNTTYPPLQAADIAPRRNLLAGEFEYAWLRCMHMCFLIDYIGMPIEPGSWAQITRDTTPDLKQRRWRHMYSSYP